MSSAGNTLQATAGGGGGASDITVKVGPVSLDRVQTIEGTIPVGVDKDRALCGKTRVNRTDPEEVSLTVTALVDLNVFETIQQLVDEEDEIQVTTAGWSGSVIFDTLEWKRTADMDTVTTDGTKLPLYNIQLISREQDQQS